jgi:hypothetical protein
MPMAGFWTFHHIVGIPLTVVVGFVLGWIARSKMQTPPS